MAGLLGPSKPRGQGMAGVHPNSFNQNPQLGKSFVLMTLDPCGHVCVCPQRTDSTLHLVYRPNNTVQGEVSVLLSERMHRTLVQGSRLSLNETESFGEHGTFWAGEQPPGRRAGARTSFICVDRGGDVYRGPGE